MARSSSPRPDDNDCLRLPATSSPRTRGAEKKESTDLRLSQPCPPYVTPSSISSFGRRLSSAHIAESKFLKNTGANRFCQSSASLETYRLHPGLPWVACESFRHRASRFVHRRTPAEPTLAGFCSHRPYLVPLELKAIWISPPLTLVLG